MLIYALALLVNAEIAKAIPIYSAQEADVKRLIQLGDINRNTRMDFSEETFKDSKGKIWKIQQITMGNGGAPMFFIPHDNEQDSFRTGIYQLKREGRGTIVMLECGEKRMCDGQDPNRYFCNASYREKIFSYFRDQRIVMTLHNNAQGCDQNGGSGSIHVDYPYPGAQGFAWGKGGRYGDGDDVLIHNGVLPPKGFNLRVQGFLKTNRINEIYEKNTPQNDCSMSFAASSKNYDYVNIDTEDRSSLTNGYRIQAEITELFLKWYGSNKVIIR
jgi:hypothetical protein